MTNQFVGEKVAVEVAHYAMDLDNDFPLGALGEPDRLHVWIAHWRVQ